jgi:hypothetical protein
LGVSTSGFYTWLERAPSARTQSDARLVDEIKDIHRHSRQTYGMPRVHAELRAQGVRVGGKRVARLMRAAGLRGVSRRKWVTTTVRDANARPAPDLVQRHFSAAAPDALWVADITYIPTWAGFLYLAVVLDAFSRRVVGWAMETHLRSELVLQALEMAYGQRRPGQVVHHSDQGTQDGFKRSSQRIHGGCDDNAKTAVRSIGTGEVALTRPSASWAARGATEVLDGDCGRALQRGSSGERSSIAGGRGTMVSGGRGNVAIAPYVGAAAVGALLVLRGAGADRKPHPI